MTKKPYGILALHGFCGNPDFFCGMEPPLKALGLPTRLPLLRGHGAASPQALRGVTWQDWVVDAESALRDLLSEAERGIVIGHSMGGLVALILAAEQGDKIDSIILSAAAIRLNSPLAPGKPLNFLAPALRLVVKQMDMTPIYVETARAQYDTGYLWAPIDSVLSFLDCIKAARKSLPKVTTPALILQSRKDTTAVPKSAEIIYNEISTPVALKRIAWFEETMHEMLLDCERDAVRDAMMDFIRERIGAKQ